MSGDAAWFLFIPYASDSARALGLELGFVITGLFLIAAGIGLAVHFNRDRSLYMRELFEAKGSDILLKNFRGKNAATSQKKKS
jgi:hypothetical protein